MMVIKSGDTADLSKDYRFTGRRDYSVRIVEKIGEKEFIIEVLGKRHRICLLDEISSEGSIGVLVDGRHHSARVLKDVQDELKISIDGNEITLLKPSFRPSKILKTPVGARMKKVDEHILTSSIPGKVLMVKVKVGDRVEKGDPLLIVESMKMEATIRSDREGVVREVYVAKGQSISSGSSLVAFK